MPVNLPVANMVENIDGEPVEVVDYLGITLLDLSSSLPLHQATSAADPGVGATLSYFIPPCAADSRPCRPVDSPA